MTAATPPAPFRVLFADPAWRFGDTLTMDPENKRGASSQYLTMSTEEIAALPVGACMADDAVGVVWRPSSMAEDGNRVLRAWDFRPVGEIVWYKRRPPLTFAEVDAIIAADLTDPLPDDAQARALRLIALARRVAEAQGKAGFGMGRLTRASKEVAVVGVRGSPYRHLKNKSVRDVFLHPALPHSQKPEIVQDAFETMFPGGPYLELFARRARSGWTAVGNECPDTIGQDICDVVPALARMIARGRSPLLTVAK